MHLLLNGLLVFFFIDDPLLEQNFTESQLFAIFAQHPVEVGRGNVLQITQDLADGALEALAGQRLLELRIADHVQVAGQVADLDAAAFLFFQALEIVL